MQPITAKEINHFPELCFALFKPSQSVVKDTFPNVAKIFPDYKYPQIKPPFSSNRDLYGRVLKKAIKADLIVKVPLKQGRKKPCFFFINSDLLFEINKGGVTISNDNTARCIRFKHRVKEFPSNTEIRFAETINLRKPVMDSLKDENTFPVTCPVQIFRLLWWVTKHQDLISQTIDTYYHQIRSCDRRRDQIYNVRVTIDDLPSEWRKNPFLFKKAIEDQLFIRSGDNLDFGPYFDNLFFYKYTLCFAPSYSILGCFSNYRQHIKNINEYNKGERRWYRRTPMELLRILTSEDYVIHPEKRVTTFTSIIMNENSLSKQYKNTLKIARNTQLAEPLLHPNSKIFHYLSSEEQYKFSTAHWVVPFPFG
jgi:hypothetical protein